MQIKGSYATFSAGPMAAAIALPSPGAECLRFPNAIQVFFKKRNIFSLSIMPMMFSYPELLQSA
ncbi:hypothetical protein [Sphingomonas bisphenolicum]